ncbi:MAG: UTP--glucose-1-phosphate uridylyltransferase, partial [Chlamydiae bacterium]|nr:UTP--glucose-1-phosphate uridylyltransferase [Chlamydiota bacterium]
MNSEIAPWTLCQTSGDAKRGKEAIAQGRVAAVVLAAGQGSRFDPAKLKGEVPVTASGKSLFCLMAERIAAASKLYKRPLKVAFMTSPQNDAQVRNYFAQNGNFGLQQEQLDFFQQSEQQLLDEKMEPFHSGPNQWAKGPDGNGA